MKSRKIYRWLCYLSGMCLLTLGLTLNTKAGLGVAPIISVAYCISQIFHLNFGNVTLIWYCMFVLSQMMIHLVCKRGKKVLVLDSCQIVVSLIVTRFLNLFSALIPDYAADYSRSFMGSIAGRMVMLVLAIILTGIGAAMSLNMRIVPNTGDGIVQAIADVWGKSVGFTKNFFDFFCAVLTFAIGIFLGGEVIGLGIGSVFSMIGVGRVIAVFNYFTMEPMLGKAGLS